MIKEKIANILQGIVKELSPSDSVIDLEHPINSAFGDYSTSIALKLTKQLKKTPIEVAQMIVNEFPKNPFIEKVEVIKPGFINFWLADEYLLKNVQTINSGNFKFPSFHFGKEKKVMVEYAHPNTLKLFHIGHLRNIITGESIVRILEVVGNKLIRSNYQGDE
ncbi:arginine--tRNA ligase [Candidatus Roizmanbacteria bacterium]|nr:arginine--tRNA ligase [Candidatus Roizmanbacteria bacterium]